MLIQNCDILRQENGQTQIDLSQDILIEGNRITSITATGATNNYTETQVIEGRGFLAIPGLINTHSHIPMVLFRGLVEDVSIDAWFNDYIFPLESNLTPEDVYWGALLGIAEMIENGVTTSADMYFFMDQVAEAVRDAGTRGHLAWSAFGHEGEEKLDQGVDFIEQWKDTAEGRITPWFGPHAPYTCPPDFLRAAVKRAKEHNVGIQIHVSETAEQVELSVKDYGITPIKMLEETGILDVPVVLGHCLYPSDEDINILKGRSAGVAHAPKTYLKLGMGTAPLMKFQQAGIPVGMATDGAVSSNSLDILEQIRLMALTQKQESADSTSMTTHEVLRIAFQGSARVLHCSNDLGQIKQGYLADIVLLRQDGLNVFPRYNPAANLVYSSRSSDVDTVICNGKILMKNRHLLTIDKDKVKQEVTARLSRLSQRVPGQRVATYPA